MDSNNIDRDKTLGVNILLKKKKYGNTTYWYIDRGIMKLLELDKYEYIKAKIVEKL